jgi:hypothetical protein
MTSRSIVAQFYKSAGGRFTLWSLVSIEEEKARDGSGETWLMRKTYDVDLSRKFGYLYHESGCGGSGPVSVDGIYFTSGEVTVKEEPNRLCERSKTTRRWKTKEIRARNRTRRLRELPKFFRSEFDLLEWLEVNGINQESVWCSECKDSMPGDDLCAHCWWCDKTGWYSTPSERCGCKNRDECES